MEAKKKTNSAQVQLGEGEEFRDNIVEWAKEVIVPHGFGTLCE